MEKIPRNNTSHHRTMMITNCHRLDNADKQIDPPKLST